MSDEIPKVEGAAAPIPDMSFADALKQLMLGMRMSARFMPEAIFIELQKPDKKSMNTELYLKMVTITDTDANGALIVTPCVQACEPWEPGRRSLFSNDWYVSKYQGIPIEKK